ncbi:MAG TPA: hypothetical protein VFB65_02185 [Pyrinomonadaceae bacterium]|nr:hypothetical protein [Pyrinomonadaceae bacterium]
MARIRQPSSDEDRIWRVGLNTPWNSTWRKKRRLATSLPLQK